MGINLKALQAEITSLLRERDVKAWEFKCIHRDLKQAGITVAWTDSGGSEAPGGWSRRPYVNLGEWSATVKRAEVAEQRLARFTAMSRKDARAQLAVAEAEIASLRASRDAAVREADRLRHGVPVEGDFVCPDAARADVAETENVRLRAYLELMARDVERGSARGRVGGQSVNDGGGVLGSASPSVLSYLSRTIRDALDPDNDWLSRHDAEVASRAVAEFVDRRKPDGAPSQCSSCGGWPRGYCPACHVSIMACECHDAAHDAEVREAAVQRAAKADANAERMAAYLRDQLVIHDSHFGEIYVGDTRCSKWDGICAEDETCIRCAVLDALGEDDGHFATVERTD